MPRVLIKPKIETRRLVLVDGEFFRRKSKTLAFVAERREILFPQNRTRYNERMFREALNRSVDDKRIRTADDIVAENNPRIEPLHFWAGPERRRRMVHGTQVSVDQQKSGFYRAGGKDNPVLKVRKDFYCAPRPQGLTCNSPDNRVAKQLNLRLLYFSKTGFERVTGPAALSALFAEKSAEVLVINLACPFARNAGSPAYFAQAATRFYELKGNFKGKLVFFEPAGFPGCFCGLHGRMRKREIVVFAHRIPPFPDLRELAC